MDSVFWTIVAGTVVYSVNQILQKFLLEPVKDYKKWVLATSHKLKYWENILVGSNVNEDLKITARGDMRDLAANIESKYLLIPMVSDVVIRTLFGLPEKEAVKSAVTSLIQLSNGGGDISIKADLKQGSINNIRSKLNIEM